MQKVNGEPGMRVKEILQNASLWYPSGDNKSATPLVSVLLPTWARAKSGLFEQAVRSVLSQTIRELELIIVDDCSVDGTSELIKEFMRKDPRVSCIRHTYNIGLPAISEYEAYCKARGEWIAFIFDDNEWERDAIEKLLKCAKKENVKAVAGKYKLFTGKDCEQFENPALWIDLGGRKECVSEITFTNTIANGSVMLHRDVLEDVGLYDPHVSITRLCDWDLWKRISCKYRFGITDELIGREKGFALGDSLGNSRKMDTWVACEQMMSNRNEKLRPDAFEECEVFGTDDANSPFFCRHIVDNAEQYRAKKWFHADDNELCEAAIRGKKKWEGKRIAYLFPEYLNASSELSWFRLNEKGSKYIVRPYQIASGQYNAWSMADVVVIERWMGPLTNAVLQWANSMEIPCYYYNDDNFEKLKEDLRGTAEYDVIEQLAKEQTPKILEQFSGIIVSTENLRQYYLKKQLKQRIGVFPPLMPSDDMMQPYHPPVDKTINIAFLGGSFRTSELIKSVIPALIHISEERSICLHCPEDVMVSIEKAVYCKSREKMEDCLLEVSDHFTVCSFKRMLSLSLCLSELKQRNISIQIHCGSSMSNNRYKSCNALINATTLGAVLIATKDMPYTEIESSHAFLMAENGVDAWEKALKQAMDAQKHQKIYQAAVEYCKARYAPSVGEAALDQIFMDNQSLQVEGLVDRMAKQMEWLRIQLHLKTVKAPVSSDCGMTSNIVSGGLFRQANDLVAYVPKRRVQRVVEHIRKPSISEMLKKMNLDAYCESKLYISQSKVIPRLSDVIPYHGYVEYTLNGIGNLVQFFLIGRKGDSCVVEFVENGKIVLQMETLVNGWGKVCIPLGAIRGEITVRLKVNDPNMVIRTFEYLDWKHAHGEIALFGWIS